MPGDLPFLRQRPQALDRPRRLVGDEAGNRQAQERTRAGKRGIRIVYRLLKSLIASILANIPMLAALADAFGELCDNIEELVASGEP